jgi:hypothetical protein
MQIANPKNMAADSLIAFLSIDYSLFNQWRPGDESPDESEFTEAQASLGKLWSGQAPFPYYCEMAYFQNSLSPVKDLFPTGFRRFVLIGNSLEEQLRNVFELGFEKGFKRVLFVEPVPENVSTEKICRILEQWEEGDVIFAPAADGSLTCWGFRESAFWRWDEFRFFEPAIVVEMISEAREKMIPYRIAEL